MAAQVPSKRENSKKWVALVVVLAIGLVVFAFMVLPSLQKPPEIVSHSEQVYWGNLGSSSPATALYGLSHLNIKSGKVFGSPSYYNLTVSWYLNGELVAERRVTFTLSTGQERQLHIFVILSYDPANSDLPYECRYEIKEGS